MNDLNSILIDGRILHIEGDATGITKIRLASVHEPPVGTGETAHVSRTETRVTILMDKYHVDESLLDGNPMIRVVGRLERHNKCICIRPEHMELKPTSPREK